MLSEKIDELEAHRWLSRLSCGKGARILLNIDADDCVVAPGERPVRELKVVGEGLLRTRWGIADGDELSRRIAPITMPAPGWPSPEARGSDGHRAAKSPGGITFRRLRDHERRELEASADELPAFARNALDGERKATRGGCFPRIIVEVHASRPGLTRRRLWCVPAGQLRTALNPRNRWAASQFRHGKAPPGWTRI